MTIDLREYLELEDELPSGPERFCIKMPIDSHLHITQDLFRELIEKSKASHGYHYLDTISGCSNALLGFRNKSKK